MQPLLSIQNLSVDFISGSIISTAIKNISFSVSKGEIVALVGESGSGKSVTSLSILQLLPSPPAHYASGQIFFSENGTEQTDLLQKDRYGLQAIRGNKIAMIFQEPMTSLNPVLTCGAQIMEALLAHKKISKATAKQKTIEWFEKVKLPNPQSIFNRYPHAISGGQKQRVMIAMAMSCHPRLLICDEPTTALDVTVQKTILQLIRELQQQSGMGVIFITHDLGVVAEIADRTIVMYKGEIVEQNTVQQIFTNAQHPYTQGLLACRPLLHDKGKRLPIVSDFLGKMPAIKSEKPEVKSEKSESGNEQRITSNNKQEARDKLRTQQHSTVHDKRETDNEKRETDQQTATLLKVEHLSVWFPSKKSFLGKPIEYTKAVDRSEERRVGKECRSRW